MRDPRPWPVTGEGERETRTLDVADGRAGAFCFSSMAGLGCSDDIVELELLDGGGEAAGGGSDGSAAGESTAGVVADLAETGAESLTVAGEGLPEPNWSRRVSQSGQRCQIRDHVRSSTCR